MPIRTKAAHGRAAYKCGRGLPFPCDNLQNMIKNSLIIAVREFGYIQRFTVFPGYFFC